MRRKYKIHSLLLAFIFFSGCAVSEYIVNGNAAEIQRRPPSTNRIYSGNLGLPSSWVGKNVSELISGLGKPDMMLDVPSGSGFSDGVCKYIYVYRPKPDSGGLCYNAYVIDDLSGEVITFYCR